nr:nucleotide-binding alpha-beta plait domain-containing protein [Tanacetum cinerariifolium]
MEAKVCLDQNGMETGEVNEVVEEMTIMNEKRMFVVVVPDKHFFEKRMDLGKDIALTGSAESLRSFQLSLSLRAKSSMIFVTEIATSSVVNFMFQVWVGQVRYLRDNLDGGYMQTPLMSNSKFTRNKYLRMNPPKAKCSSNLLRVSSTAIVLTTSKKDLTPSFDSFDGVTRRILGFKCTMEDVQSVKYVGGLSLFFECGSRKEACQSLKENKTWLQQWFDDLNLRGDNDVSCGRLTWIIIEGLSVLVRNIGAVKAITNQFGKILEIGRLDFDFKVLSLIKCLVLTSRMYIICQSLDVKDNPSFEEEFIGPMVEEQAD